MTNSGECGERTNGGGTSPASPGERLTSDEYEEVTRGLVAALATIEQVQTVRLERDVRLAGRVHDHQIDVVWDYQDGEGDHRVVFECRYYKSTIKNTAVWAYNGIVNDLVEPAVGVMITRTGFQRAARSVAERHGIKLWTLRAPTEADWRGRVRTIQIDFHMEVPVLRDFVPRLARASEAEYGPETVATGDSTLRLADGSETTVLAAISDWWHGAPNTRDDTELAERRIDFDPPAVLIADDGTEVPVLGFTGRVGWRPGSGDSITIDGDEVVKFVAHDLFGDRRFVVDAEGRVRQVDTDTGE